MKSAKSCLVPTCPGIVVKKLGQPVPLSNFIFEVKRSSSHPAQTNVPSRCSSLSGLEPAGSVASSRSTANCSAVSIFRHSSSEWRTAWIPAVTSPHPPLRHPPNRNLASEPKRKLLRFMLKPRCQNKLPAGSVPGHLVIRYEAVGKRRIEPYGEASCRPFREPVASSRQG